jgi:hypothetical protein
MKRWALIENETVVNVVEQETEPQLFGSWVETPTYHVTPGWGYVNAVFVDPNPPLPLPNIITKVAFRFRMTDPEYVGILSAAKTDVEVAAWVETFNMVSQIDLDNQRTKDGVTNLVSKNLLTQARADEILTAPVQPGERP